MPVVVPIRILQGLLYVVGAYFLCASSVFIIRKIVSVPPEVSRKIPASLRNYCSNGVAVRFR